MIKLTIYHFSPTIPLSMHDSALEDKLVSSSQSLAKGIKGLRLDEKDLVLPQRPLYGEISKSKKKYELFANFFPLSMTQNNKVPVWFKWSMDVAEQVDPKGKAKAKGPGGMAPRGKKLKQIIKVFLEEHFPRQMEAHSIATEFKKFLYSTENLFAQASKDGESEYDDERIYTVKYRSEGEDKPGEKAPTFNITLTFVANISMSGFVGSLTGRAQELDEEVSSDRGDVIQALNVIMGFGVYLNDNLVYLGNSRAYAVNGQFQESQTLKDRSLDMLRGYYQSVRPATGRLLLNIQIKAGAFHRPIKVSTLMDELTHLDWRDFEAFIRRVSVDMTYINITNSKRQRIPRIKTIFGLANPLLAKGKKDGDNGERPTLIPEYAALPNQVQLFNGTRMITVKQHFISRKSTQILEQ
jgi:eukaryotic translation initiation factor 2C